MKKFLKNLKFIWGYSKNEKSSLVLIIILNLILIFLYIVSPILSAKVIINLTSSKIIQLLLVAAMILVVNCLINLVNYFCNILGIKIRRNSLHLLKLDLGKNILKLDNNCLDNNSSGVFIQRLTNDTNNLSGVFDSLLSNIFSVIKNIGVFIAIFLVNKIVFLYLLITITIIFLLQKKTTQKEAKDEKISRQYNDKVSGFVGELVRGARDIKMLNSEEDFCNELNNKIIESNDKFFLVRSNALKNQLLNNIVRNLVDYGLLALFAFLIYKNLLVSTMALVLYNYSTVVKRSIYTLEQLLRMIKDVNISCDRILEIINDDKFTKEKFGDKHLKQVSGNFQFDNVSFSYDEKNNIFENLSFKVNANETVAFVGKSGAGKTTIFNLICKMYNINSGTITIDGIDINELDKDSIRGNITIINQNPYIFNMSIKDNLKLVKNNLTDKEMKNICKIACLDEFIETLPDKYDTIVGEGGVNLSGGQKQRLAIARALIQKTEIILFDEATSALDNETQNNIQKAIENMSGEYTILIIAHRLSTIKNCNRILYLEEGQIIAEGTHNELLKKCIQYKNLYESELSNE